MFYEDINITKRETITNGAKYDFFIYDMLSLEKKHSNKKFGKGETVISKVKKFKMLDDETGEMLDVKMRCSKKLDDALDGIEPSESQEVFDKCVKELDTKGIVVVWFGEMKDSIFSFKNDENYSIKPHIRGVFYLWDDGKYLLKMTDTDVNN